VLAWAQVILGFALLCGGGELLLKGAVALARRWGVSPLLIGATVVAFGTSAPELAVCVGAAWRGHAGLALGSVVGSNMANVLLILGVAAVVSPVLWQSLAMRRDAALLIGSTLLFVILTGTGRILAAFEGGRMVAVLGTVTGLSYWYERQDPPLTFELLQKEAEQIGGRTRGLAALLLITAAGLGGLWLGSEQLIVGAIEVARTAGVSEATIGLTLVAVGTSLPELFISLLAAHRHHADIALGNVVGSCVFNQLFVAGAAALVSPLAVPLEVLQLDLWLMLAVLMLLGVLLRVRARLGRRAGLVCLLIYSLWLTSKL
jgi:cation:H+ antiporter